MLKVVILDWHDERAWTNWSGTAEQQLVLRLQGLTDLTRTELKRLAKRVLQRDTRETPHCRAASKQTAEPVRHVLESLGAGVEIQAAD